MGGMKPSASEIGALREFNRFYTRQMGLLDRGLLGSEWTLAEARVMYELARADSTTAAIIARDLGLDVGYLSRILGKLERHGLVERRRAKDDGRRQELALTATGKATFAPLDKAAKREVRELLAPLDEAARRALLDAAATIHRTLARDVENPFPVVRELRVGDVGFIVHRQARLYAEEFGWNIEYEALIAEILGAFVRNFDPRRDASFIAERHGAIVGSVFLVRGDEASKTGKLRLLYVDANARGIGLGRHLVDRCVNAARERGYTKLTLWTNDVLVAARRIYQAAGFRLVKEERHRSFGKALVGQTWELALDTTSTRSMRRRSACAD